MPVLQTFPPNPPPEFPIERTYEFATREAQFGDGYSLETPDGLNARRYVLPLRWKMLTTAEKNVIANFLNAVAPATPFVHNGPDGISMIATCRQFSVSQTNAGFWDITATLRQFHGY